ncbi:restriction endonuclease subunit S [Faecalibacterium prausnitzii]|uniref:restriction endonuclease subunit S n=1 Tax=Faecalibacterium TaxID=216851 RepID=UPI0032AF0747
MKDSGIEWIGEIPEGWRTINPKALFTQRKDKAQKGERQLTSSQQHGILYQDDYMELTGSKVVTVEKDFDILKHVEAGDFVISMRSFQGGLEYSTKSGAISSAYVMLVPNLELVYPRFYRWLLKSSVYIDALQRTTNMVRDGQAMRYSNFAQVRLFTLPLDEQKSRADFLDLECSSIDKILFKTRSSIEEYKKLKQAVITQAVTTLNCPNVKLKYLMDIIVDCPHETPIYTFTGNYLVIRTSDQSLASLRCDEDMYRLDEAEYKKRTRRLTLDKDDIVYGREGSWGLACLVPQSNKYCLGQRVMQFRCNTRLLYPKYAMYALNSETVYMQGALDTIGSTAPHVNISTICNYLLPVPSLTEQKEIADYLDAKCAEIDKLIAKKEQLVKELESYKKSLIYEVVTGKREV